MGALLQRRGCGYGCLSRSGHPLPQRRPGRIKLTVPAVLCTTPSSQRLQSPAHTGDPRGPRVVFTVILTSLSKLRCIVCMEPLAPGYAPTSEIHRASRFASVVDITSTQEKFLRQVVGAPAAVVFVPCDRDDRFGSLLGDLCDPTVGTKILCVASHDPSVARFLIRVGCSDVLWYSESLDDLVRRLRLITTPSATRVLRDLAVTGDSLSPLMRAALRRLCHPDAPPISTVGDWASAIGAGESTLRRAWREELADSTPSQLVRWVLLLRAIMWASRGDGLLDVSIKLGVHETTVARISKALTGRSYCRNRSGAGLTSTLNELWAWAQASGLIAREPLLARSVPEMPDVERNRHGSESRYHVG